MSIAVRRLAICAALGLAVSAATQPLNNVNPLAIMSPGPLTIPLAIMSPGPLDTSHERVAIMSPGPLRQQSTQQIF